MKDDDWDAFFVLLFRILCNRMPTTTIYMNVEQAAHERGNGAIMALREFLRLFDKTSSLDK